jgi:hypothetical protein
MGPDAAPAGGWRSTGHRAGERLCSHRPGGNVPCLRRRRGNGPRDLQELGRRVVGRPVGSAQSGPRVRVGQCLHRPGEQCRLGPGDRVARAAAGGAAIAASGGRGHGHRRRLRLRRSGAGTCFSAYGVVAPGAAGEIAGKSSDGQWWQVKIPTQYAASGLGWVGAAFVTTAKHGQRAGGHDRALRPGPGASAGNVRLLSAVADAGRLLGAGAQYHLHHDVGPAEHQQ